MKESDEYLDENGGQDLLAIDDNTVIYNDYEYVPGEGVPGYSNNDIDMDYFNAHCVEEKQPAGLDPNGPLVTVMVVLGMLCLIALIVFGVLWLYS